MTVCTKQVPILGLVLPGLDTGAVTGALPVPVALALADESPAATVWDIAELREANVDQLAGTFALVASGRLAGDPVDVG